MAMLELDSSAIFVEAVNNRLKEELTEAYFRLIGRLKKAGMSPRKHIMNKKVTDLNHEWDLICEEFIDCIGVDID